MITAERHLSISSNGTTLAVPVRVEAPVFDRNAWVSNYSIGWPEGTFQHRGMGADSAQALMAAFRFVAIQLYASSYHKNGVLAWDKPGDGYGFPLPADSRALAVGRDRDL